MTLVSINGGGGAPMARSVWEATVGIAASGSNSDTIPTGRYGQGSFQIPGAFTGTTVQPQFSNDGSNWTAVGSAISVSTDNTYAIPADCFKAKYMRLVSNGAEAAARTITLFFKF